MGHPPFAGRGKLILTPDIKINWEGDIVSLEKIFLYR